jgi:hypothetical protein
MYPNPASNEDDVSIDLSDVPNGLYTIDILDMQGVAVKTTQLNIHQAAGTSVISLNNLLNGIYVVRITTPDYTVNRKLMVRQFDIQMFYSSLL